MIRHLPNFFTCCNLLCGCLGTVSVLENRPYPAAYFVWAACIFDFMDGFTARALKVSSPVGKELDSLADVISFGLLPALTVYKLWPTDAGVYLPFLSFSIVVFSAIRLAIFNIDETQRDSFRGLPTPANALLLTALPLQSEQILSWLIQLGILIAIVLIMSYLLVSPVELFALKFKDFAWRGNQKRIIFLALSAVLLASLQVAAIPIIIILYILLSLTGKALAR